MENDNASTNFKTENRRNKIRIKRQTEKYLKDNVNNNCCKLHKQNGENKKILKDELQIRLEFLNQQTSCRNNKSVIAEKLISKLEMIESKTRITTYPQHPLFSSQNIIQQPSLHYSKNCFGFESTSLRRIFSDKRSNNVNSTIFERKEEIVSASTLTKFFFEYEKLIRINPFGTLKTLNSQRTISFYLAILLTLLLTFSQGCSGAERSTGIPDERQSHLENVQHSWKADKKAIKLQADTYPHLASNNFRHSQQVNAIEKAPDTFSTTEYETKDITNEPIYDINFTINNKNNSLKYKMGFLSDINTIKTGNHFTMDDLPSITNNSFSFNMQSYKQIEAKPNDKIQMNAAREWPKITGHRKAFASSNSSPFVTTRDSEVIVETQNKHRNSLDVAISNDKASFIQTFENDGSLFSNSKDESSDILLINRKNIRKVLDGTSQFSESSPTSSESFLTLRNKVLSGTVSLTSNDNSDIDDARNNEASLATDHHKDFMKIHLDSHSIGDSNNKESANLASQNNFSISFDKIGGRQSNRDAIDPASYRHFDGRKLNDEKTEEEGKLLVKETNGFASDFLPDHKSLRYQNNLHTDSGRHRRLSWRQTFPFSHRHARSSRANRERSINQTDKETTLSIDGIYSTVTNVELNVIGTTRKPVTVIAEYDFANTASTKSFTFSNTTIITNLTTILDIDYHNKGNKLLDIDTDIYNISSLNEISKVHENDNNKKYSSKNYVSNLSPPSDSLGTNNNISHSLNLTPSPNIATNSSRKAISSALVARSVRSSRASIRNGNTRKGKTGNGSKVPNNSVSSSHCSLGYYGCNNGSCVRADRYCDGKNDCPKGEDEPPHCSREYSNFQKV